MKKRLMVRGFREKFILAFLILVPLLMYTIGRVYYDTTWEEIYSIAKNDIFAMTTKNNQIIDQKLQLANEYANGLIVDTDIETYLDQYQQAETAYEVFVLDRPISTILDKYFLYFKDVLTVNIMTKRLPYGSINATNVIPAEGFSQSSVCRQVLATNGYTLWIPTYNFFDEYQQAYLHLKGSAYQYVFSAAKLIRKFDNGDYAILILVFLDNVYANVFHPDSDGSNGQFLVFSKEGQTISSSDTDLFSPSVKDSLLAAIPDDGRGVNLVNLNGDEYIVGYQTSSVTDWISCIVISKSELMKSPLQSIIRNLLIILFVLLIALLLFLSFLSFKLFKPLDELYSGMYKSGHGEFDVEILESGMAEMRQLTRRFNKMNRQIKTLIKENYEMVILQKEQDLNTYNLQLDPHFILNSLNLLNLELIGRGQEDLSNMTSDLSSIMDYLLRTNEILVPFKLDWEHTLNYLRIMSHRYQNSLSYETHIDSDTLDVKIPKLLLQPLVENSIMHGFCEQGAEGHLAIAAKLSDKHLVVRIEDNGKGFLPVQIDDLISKEPIGHGKHEGGLRNVLFRLQRIYGDQYDFSIDSTPWVSTVVIIRVPLQKDAGA